MIIEQQKEAIILQQGIRKEDSTKTEIDLESADFLMQMLSKSLYSDPIGSLIRESVSNAIDSHKKANVSSNVIVKFGIEDDNEYEFSVEDTGLGLDDEEIKTVISKYGKSTKREDNTQKGGWGLGWKAPLAYSNHFFFITRKNNIERKYIMYAQDDANNIDLLYEEKTKEPNGVKIIVPVKSYDRREFINKIKEQLCYFDNVLVEIIAEETSTFTIHKESDFQTSNFQPDQCLHMTLDNVYYPLDWSALGIDKINIPIALKFELSDGIIPIPSRESIKYTKNVIKLIKDKIGKVADFFVNLYNQNIKESSEPFALYYFLRDSNKYLKYNSIKYCIGSIIPYTTIELQKPFIKGISHIQPENLLSELTNTDVILSEYEIQYNIVKNKWSQTKRYYYDKIVKISKLKQKTVLYYKEKSPKGLKKSFINELYGDRTWHGPTYVIKKIKDFKLGNKDSKEPCYFSILELHSVPKDQWRIHIKEFQYFISLFTANWVNIDKIEVPTEYVLSKIKKKVVTPVKSKRVKLLGEIAVNKAEQLLRWSSGKNCKWVRQLWSLENIHKQKNLIVYGTIEDTSRMDKLFKVLNNYSQKNKITLIQLNEKELKIINNCKIHNLISMEKFMTGENMPFKRIITSYLINKLIKKNKFLFDKIGKIGEISKELEQNCQLLDKYVNDNYTRGCDEIYNAMLEVAENKNLFDIPMYTIYLKTKNVLDEMTFLNILFEHLSYSDNVSEKEINLITIIKDLCKYHKFKMNWENYNLPLTEEAPVEESILETI